MNIVGELYQWTDFVVVWGLVALRTWALVDCATRKAAAFPAVDKLTKVGWLLMLAIGDFLGWYTSLGQPIGIFSLITAVLASVYLADVRPAVREISEGR